jgi:hypothetical protein
METKERSTQHQGFSEVAQKKVAPCTSCELRTILSPKELPHTLHTLFAQLLSAAKKHNRPGVCIQSCRP